MCVFYGGETVCVLKGSAEISRQFLPIGANYAAASGAETSRISSAASERGGSLRASPPHFLRKLVLGGAAYRRPSPGGQNEET